MIMRCLKQLMAVTLGIFLLTTSAIAQDAGKKPEIKDKTVKTLMKFAFGLMPEVYTGPDGKKITINKKNPDEVIIPVDDARRIILVADRSAKAQNCDLKVMQTLNHNAMVKYEQIFKSWTDKQKLFINQLHLFTVLYMTGNVKFNEKQKTKEQIAADVKKSDVKNTYKCSDDERKKVAASVDEYLEKMAKAIKEELIRRKKLGSTNEKKNKEVKKAQK